MRKHAGECKEKKQTSKLFSSVIVVRVGEVFIPRFEARVCLHFEDVLFSFVARDGRALVFQLTEPYHLWVVLITSTVAFLLLVSKT